MGVFARYSIIHTMKLISALQTVIIFAVMLIFWAVVKVSGIEKDLF